MEQPESFSDGSHKVCRLIKSIYGLKQSPRCWNYQIDQFLLKSGWSNSNADPCLYIRLRPRMFLALYVDDGLLFYGEANACTAFERQLSQRFESNFGPADVFLGIEIERDKDGSFRLHQSGYAKRIIERFRLQDAKPVNSPFVNEDITHGSDPVPVGTPYREAVGALLYLALGTRPDIAFAVNFCSRSLVAPTVRDWSAITRVIRYVKGTCSLGPVYPTSSTCKGIRVYSDADFGGCTQSRRSTSGILVFLEGGPIIWSSRRQPIVALSTTEAEFIAASDATKEAIWTRLFVTDLYMPACIPELLIDNQSTVSIIKDPTFHQRTKHIDIRYKFIRDHYNSGELLVNYVPGTDQLADFLTKGLTGPILAGVLRVIGIRV